MSTEGRKGRGQKPELPPKDSKEGKAGKSTESLKKANVQELDTQKAQEVKVKAEAYQVVFYMKHFRVTDIIVKVENETLIIDACHREHADEHGLVTRSSFRKFKLPKNINLKTLASSFTGNGFLVIHAEYLDNN